MNRKSLVMVSPHNWYDHVVPNKINRPLKIVEQYYNKRFFNNILIVNRIHPKRILNSTRSKKRELVNNNPFYNLFYDMQNEIYYLEHCFPFGKLEKFFLPNIIRKITDDLGFNNFGLLISDPKSTYLFTRIEATKVFDAYDDWSLSPLFNSKKRHVKYITSGYNHARLHADIILTNTEHMKSKMKNENNNVHLLSNASSLVYDSVSYEKSGEVKVIGYIGNIHERLDLKIIEGLLENFTEEEFIFVGKNDFNSNKFNAILDKFSNIKLVGPVSYELVPAYIKKFDVCIVPHIVNDYTLSQDSMKIYDYLTFGKPIVSTKIPPTERFDKYVYSSNSVEEFLENVKIALDENDISLANERIQFMKKNNWRNIAKNLYSLIQEV